MTKNIEKKIINNEIHYSRPLTKEEIETMKKINEQLKIIIEKRKNLKELKKETEHKNLKKSI